MWVKCEEGKMWGREHVGKVTGGKSKKSERKTGRWIFGAKVNLGKV